MLTLLIFHVNLSAGKVIETPFLKIRRIMTMIMKTATIFPPKMEAIGQALDLFGERRVLPGEWNEPIIVSELTVSEFAFAVKFFGEMGCEVQQIQETRTLRRSASRDVLQVA
jgi:hypothetical protein